MNITKYINLQDSIGFGLSNEFLERKLVKISKKVVEVSYISQVPTKAVSTNLLYDRIANFVLSEGFKEWLNL